MKMFLILLFSVLFIFNSSVFAEDTETIETEADIYHFPEIKPEADGLLGYRLVSLGGSEKAGEFEYLHSSPVIGVEMRAFPFPHRLHLEADVLNKKDYFIDMGYSYKDLILFRGINRTLFHNLDNLTLIDPQPTVANTDSREVFVRDAGEKYGVFADLKNVFLRLKTPDFPFHVYFDGKVYNRDSSSQHTLYSSPTATATWRGRISEKRETDLNLRDYTIGMNSHLGPVEADLSHGEKRLDVTGDKIVSNYYNKKLLPYGLLPDLKSSTNTLKLHTSYTGRLVASASVSSTDKENRDSGAKADYFAGSADITYVPFTTFTLVARYKHKEADLDNPLSLPAGYLGYSGFTTTTGIKPSLSSQTDTVSGFARFRPFKGLGLNAEYTYERAKRKNSDEWNISEKTIQRNMVLSANIRPFKKLTFKTRYVHLDVSNPSYNTQPDTSDSGSISMSWNPFTWANTLLSYSIAKDKRDNLNFAGYAEAKNRTAKRDKLLGNITFMLSDKLSVTPSYAYSHNKIKQDLLIDNTANIGQLDKDVPYKDTANSYSLNVNYAPKKNLNINADASETRGRGGFYPGKAGALQSNTIASFSVLKVKETAYSIGSDYRFRGDWAVGLKYKYNNFKDMINNPYDDAKNGIARIILLTISKKW